MLYPMNMKALIIIAFTTIIAFLPSSMTYAKSGGYSGISEIGHYTIGYDNPVVRQSKDNTPYAYGEKFECGKNLEHSCQAFGIFISKFALFLNNNHSIEGILFSPLRTQVSLLQYLKPPRP